VIRLYSIAWREEDTAFLRAAFYGAGTVDGDVEADEVSWVATDAGGNGVGASDWDGCS